MGFIEYQIIDLVKMREILWNPNHPSFEDRFTKHKVWGEVADIVGLKDYEARTKWNHLRARYRRTLRIINDNKLAKITWPYFQPMQFVKDYLNPKKNLENGEVLYHHMEGESSKDFSEKRQECPDSNRLEKRVLINFIKAREPLWNRSHPLYQDTYAKAQLWKEIADILGLEERFIRNKWDCMRNYFKLELRKIEDTKDMVYVPKWRFFDDMMFLKGILKPTKTDNCDTIKPIKTLEYSDSSKPQASIEEVLYHHKEGEPFEGFLENSQECPVSNPPKERDALLTPIKISNLTAEEPIKLNTRAGNNKIRVINFSNNEDKLLKNFEEITPIESNIIIEKPLNHAQCSQETKVDDDDDYYFAMSIVPSMESLPRHRKLYIRTKIQEYLYNEHVSQQTQSSFTKFTYT